MNSTDPASRAGVTERRVRRVLSLVSLAVFLSLCSCILPRPYVDSYTGIRPLDEIVWLQNASGSVDRVYVHSVDSDFRVEIFVSTPERIQEESECRILLTVEMYSTGIAHAVALDPGRVELLVNGVKAILERDGTWNYDWPVEVTEAELVFSTSACTCKSNRDSAASAVPNLEIVLSGFLKYNDEPVDFPVVQGYLDSLAATD